MDRDELEARLEEIRKQLQQIKKKIVPDHLIDQLKHDVKTLNTTLNEKDRILELQKKQLKDLNTSQRQAISAFDKLKGSFEQRVKKVRDSYEKELKQIKHNLTQTIRPGELKAIGILLEKVDIRDFTTMDYKPTVKDMRTARDKFQRLSEDPNTPHAQKFLYDHLKDHMNYRIDFLNLHFEKPVETPKARDVLYNSKEGVLGLWYKSLRLIKKYLPTFLVTSLAGIFSWFVTTIITVTHGASKTVINIVRYVAPTLAAAMAIAGTGTIVLAWKILDTLQWFANHIYEIVVGGITASIAIYKAYGEEASFPILAFWSIVIAYTMALLSKTMDYVERVRKYLYPFSDPGTALAPFGG